jgi:hypothetical protein
MTGLYDAQIFEMMKKYPQFAGVIARDQIDLIKPYVEKNKYVGFVINLDKSNQDGSHWNSILIDYRPKVGSHSIEYYDSFGRRMPKDIEDNLKKIINPNLILKKKENYIQRQDDESSNCGFFAIDFLEKRFKGLPFKEASGATEKEIKKLKHIKGFGMF